MSRSKYHDDDLDDEDCDFDDHDYDDHDFDDERESMKDFTACDKECGYCGHCDY